MQAVFLIFLCIVHISECMEHKSGKRYRDGEIWVFRKCFAVSTGKHLSTLRRSVVPSSLASSSVLRRRRAVRRNFPPKDFSSGIEILFSLSYPRLLGLLGCFYRSNINEFNLRVTKIVSMLVWAKRWRNGKETHRCPLSYYGGIAPVFLNRQD